MSVDLRILSLGAGVQSTTMYLMACEGEIGPLPDYAIFADTQQEPPWVYENLDRLAEEWRQIPIIRATAGDLGKEIDKTGQGHRGRRVAVPFWTRDESGRSAPGSRSCTTDFKILVIKRQIRELLGLKPGERAKGRFHVESWIGISLDEVQRCKPSREEWITNRWPLIFDRPTHREECKTWLTRHGYPIPGKSACVFCPYRQDVEWATWRDERPDLFEAACEWDEKLRADGSYRGMNGLQYVSRRLVSLRELPPREELEKHDRNQLDLFGDECEGMCGV